LSARPLDLAQIYAEQADFVWLTLARLGVRESDREDVMQEVFLVVHRRLDSLRAQEALRSWLYSICRRSVSNHRRRAYHTRERSADGLELELAPANEADGPEEAAVAKEAHDQLEVILGGLSDNKRIVFVMFEIELRTALEIATALAIPLGTVHSRIHAARRDVERIAARFALAHPEKIQ